MIKFKINNCLLISLLLITISNAFQIVSDNTYINYAGGYVKVKFYYDDEEKLMGYKYTNPVNMEVLYDYKNHVTYKRGNYVGNSDYYVDYFDFNTTNKAANINNNSSNFYKFEKIYYYDDFPIIDSKQHTINGHYGQSTEISGIKQMNIIRPYSGVYRSIMSYDDSFQGSNVEYMYYTGNDELLEFKLTKRDLTFVLGKVEKTKIDIRKEFGVYSDDFSNTITKSNSEIDIIFLLDESENIAEEEFNKIIDFCKISVMQYSLELDKTRFAIVGYGSYGVLHLDFTNSIYDIITTLDKLKTQQIRGKSCLGCGLSIASGVFDNSDRDVQQMLINVMASKVDYPTYYGECIKKNQTTYYDYCIDSCNKLEYEQCSDQYDHDVIIKNKVIKGKRSAIQCQNKNYNENGYSCSDCSCSEDKKYVLCKECKLKKEYAYKRCRNTKQALGCDSDNIITYYENYTKSKGYILPTGSNRIIVNIGIGEETHKQVNELSTRTRRKLNFETDYKFSSFDQFKNVSSITNFTSHISEYLYDRTGNECGKHCKGVCGLNGQCYCPTECYGDDKDEDNYVVCITDDKNITVSGCEKASKLCSPPLTEEGIPNMCYIATFDTNTKKCKYELKQFNEEPQDKCKVNICDPRDGSLKTVENPAFCYVPENRSNVEMIIGDDNITVDITYKLVRPCETINNICFMAVYETICTSNSKYYDCRGIDGKCICILNETTSKECEDIIDTTNNIYKYAKINGNKCEYDEYNMGTGDSCSYELLNPTTQLTVKRIPKYKDCIEPKSNFTYAFTNGIHVKILYEHSVSSNCYDVSGTCNKDNFAYTTSCKSLDPRYTCEYDDTKNKCVCELKEDSDCTIIYPYLDGQINYCYMYEHLDNEHYCRYRQRFSSQAYDGYHICDTNGVGGTKDIVFDSTDPEIIYSINESNALYIGTIRDYTFGGQVFDVKLDESNIIKVYSGYEKVGKIVYDEFNQPVLTLNKFNISLPSSLQYTGVPSDIACSVSKCIEKTNIPTSTKQYKFYTMDVNTDEYPLDYLKPSNTYYNVMSGISISQIHPINHPFGNHQDCISEDKCYIGFETYDGKCLQSQLILPETNDAECFEYVCDDGKLIQKPLNDQFTRINSPCVKKYGDVLKIFNGKAWYYHLTKYVNRLFDILFVVSIVIVIAISFGVGIVINFIRIKKIKGYIKLDNNENIELEDVDNMAK